MNMRHAFLGVLTAVAVSAAGSAVAQDKSIIVQSTTSTQNSGLYDYILPKVKADTGITANVVAVGTGQALKNASNCDGDVLIVHAKPAEMKFVEAGNGVKRYDLMYNDFVIVGPADDPAGVSGMKDVTKALQTIADKKIPFASRGDDSGTDKAEKRLWADLGTDPTQDSGKWYRETGSGMGATLNTAVGMGAYALTDRATWINYKNKGDYRIAVEGDKRLYNQYGIIMVNPDKCPDVKADLSKQFMNWWLSEKGQQTIADYKVDGQQLFFPNASQHSIN